MSTENKAKAREFYLTRRKEDGGLTHICLHQYYAEHNPLVLVPKDDYLLLQSQLDDCKRKGEEWQGCAESLAVDNKNLTSQLDEKTDECEKLKLQLKNRSSHLQTATVDGIHKAWEENAKLRAELEEAKATTNQAVYEADKAKQDRDKYLDAAQLEISRLREVMRLAESILTLTHPELEKCEMDTLTTRQYMLWTRDSNVTALNLNSSKPTGGENDSL